MADERTKRRIAQIKEMVPIAQILSDYGYPVRTDGEDREEQFPCDLHGDGHDNKPSARMYPETGSFYCFACGVSRDAVDLVKEKEGLNFGEALKHLEVQYDLPYISWEEGDYETVQKPEDEIQALLKYPERTFADDLRVFLSVITGETQDRSLPMRVAASFWEGADQVAHLVEKELLSEIKGRAVMQNMLERLHKAIKEASNAGTPGSIQSGR